MMATLFSVVLWAQAPVGTTLFSEDFSSFAKDAVPSGQVTTATGRVVYGDATVTYTTGGSNSKIYEEAIATGTSPEILIGKNGGSLTIEGIPSGGAKEITVSYKQNKQKLKVESTTTGYTGSKEEKPADVGANSFDITVADGSAATFDLVFTCTGSSNVRVDDIAVTVKTAGEGGGDTPVEPKEEFYLTGSFRSWATTADANFKFAATATEGEYSLEAEFDAEITCKAIGLKEGADVKWYPDGMGNDLALEAGEYTIYLRPAGNAGEGWHEGVLKAEKKQTPVVEPITCLDVYQMAKGDKVELLNDVTVTFANGKNVWVRDGSASMLIFLPSNGSFVAGDVLSGVAGDVDVYNGVHEIKPTADQVAAITATHGEAPAAIQASVVEAADVNKYIVMPEVQAVGTFTEGTQSNLTINNVTVRNQFKNGYEFVEGKKYNVYGVVTLYQNNPQVYFITAEIAGDAPVEPKEEFYLTGSFRSWATTADANFKFAATATEGEYALEAEFDAEVTCKAIGLKEGADVKWYPDGMGNDLALEAGEYTIYLRPAGNAGEGWHEGVLKAVKNVPSSCADIYSLAKGDKVKLNEVVVTYANGKNVYVKDESGAMLIFLPSASTDFAAGDVLSGVEGVIDIYNGLYELKPSADQVAAIAKTAGVAPEPEVFTVAPTAADMNTYFIVNGVTVAAGEFTTASATNLNLTIGEETVVLRNSFKLAYTFEEDKKYDVVAVGAVYNSTVQMYFISAKVATGTAVDNATVAGKAQKMIIDGQLFIIRDGVMFNANGAAVK